MPSWKLTEHKKNERSGGAGTREHLPLPRRQTFEILYFSTHFKLKRTIKILCLVQPRLQLPLSVSVAIPPCRPVWFPSYHHLGQMAAVACAPPLLPSRYINQPYHQQPRRPEGGWSAATAILGAFTSQRGSEERARRTGARSWDGVNTALNVVFLYYTRSYTVLCAHFSLIILNILWTRR